MRWRALKSFLLFLKDLITSSAHSQTQQKILKARNALFLGSNLQSQMRWRALKSFLKDLSTLVHTVKDITKDFKLFCTLIDLLGKSGCNFGTKNSLLRSFYLTHFFLQLHIIHRFKSKKTTYIYSPFQGLCVAKCVYWRKSKNGKNCLKVIFLIYGNMKYFLSFLLNINTLVVCCRHGGGWSRKINAWYLYTLMVYL